MIKNVNVRQYYGMFEKGTTRCGPKILENPVRNQPIQQPSDPRSAGSLSLEVDIALLLGSPFNFGSTIAKSRKQIIVDRETQLISAN